MIIIIIDILFLICGLIGYVPDISCAGMLGILLDFYILLMRSLIMASFPMCLAIILRRAAILSYRMCAIGSRSFAQLVHSKVRSTFRLLELGPMAKAMADRRLRRAEMLTWEASTPR